jgi:hypothetical protein
MAKQRCLFGVALGLASIVTVDTSGSRPLLQMPVPCGQTWDVSTYNGHWPDADSIDMAERDDDGDNISEGEPVLASAAGTVIDVVTSPGGDHRVYLDHGNGWATHYIHIEEEPPLAIGQRVAQGEQIARTSNSGAVAMHIHYSQVTDHDPVSGGDAHRIQFNGANIQTHAGNSDSYGTWGSDDAERLTSLNCAGNSFMGWNQSGERYHLIYKPGTGEVKIVRMAADGAGVTTTWSGQWSRGWTHFIPYYQAGNGHPHAIVYKSSTGQVGFLRMDLWGNGVTDLSSGTWYGGWTHFVPFTIDGDPHFLAYDSLHGYANIDRINPLGNSTTTVYQGAWNKGRTSIVPFKMGPTQYLLLYKGGTGAVEINQLAKNGNTMTLTEVWSGSWSGGWTDLVPVSHEGGQYLLGYKAASGDAKIFKLKSGGQGVDTITAMDWTTPWTAFSPFTIDGKGHVLVYKAGTGEVKTLRLKAGGAGVLTVWDGSWTTGWT